ncbi:MAG: esterase-like activity of phytase family protein [Rhizobiaceae bacterium]|nr:esterase-like activity of phytase family protein [Rhizobiaceae bacterium]
MRVPIVRMLMVALFLLAMFLPANTQSQLHRDINIRSRIISYFHVTEPNIKRFGKLEFLGGIEIFSDDDNFGGYSGFRFNKNRSDFIAVSDIGFWLTGTLRRENGLPVGIKDAVLAPIRDTNGQVVLGKESSDAEALEIVGNQIYVAFERDHRVGVFNLDQPNFTLGKSRALKINFNKLNLRGNKGLETIVSAPPASPLHGQLLMITERSLNKKRDIRAFIYGGGKLQEFSIARTNQFDITDGKFLPNGDLILLERRFTVATGAALRLRRFKSAAIKPGARLTGETLMFADKPIRSTTWKGWISPKMKRARPS